MSTYIPIWPGSSSFTTGSTPHGYYDNDPVFQQEADMVAKWCAIRLGYPVMNVELQDIHFYAAFEESISEFSAYVNSYNIKDNLIYVAGTAYTGSEFNSRKISKNFGNMVSMAKEYGSEAGSGGKVTYKSGSVILPEGVNKVDLKEWANTYESGSAISIKQVFNQPTPASVRYLLPFTSNNAAAQAFGFGQYSTAVSFLMMPLHGDVLRMQMVEFNDQIRRSQYSFQLRNNVLTIFPIPRETRRIIFEYIVDSERSNPLKDNRGLISDMSNVPYGNKPYQYINSVGRQWIKKYTLACAMQTLGNIRNKYSSIPIPNSDISLNGDSLITSAETMKENLTTELKEFLETLTTKSLMEAKQQESEFLRNTLKGVPSKIYIG